MGASAETARLEVDGASWVVVLPDRDTDYIQSGLADSLTPYEHQMLRDMASRLHAGDLVVDVGANVGNHSLYLAAVAGCRVHAFEPDAHLASAVREATHLSGLEERLEVHAVALGAEPAKGTLVSVGSANIGGQRLRLTADGSVTVTTLDEVQLPGTVHCLKVDVEGMDLDVLRGAEQLLTRDRPLVYVEAGTEVEFAATAEFLDGLGYLYWDTFNATPTHLFQPSERVDATHAQRRAALRAAKQAYAHTAEVSAVRSSLDRANEKYRTATQAHAALRDQLNARVAEVNELRASVSTATEDAAVLRSRLRVATEELRASRDRVSEVERQLGAATAEASTLRSDAEQRIAALDRRLGESEDRGAELQQAQHRSEAKVASLLARVAALRTQHRADLALVDEVSSSLDSLRTEHSEAQDRLRAMDKALIEERATTALLRDRLGAAGEVLEAVSIDRDRLASRAERLQEELDSSRQQAGAALAAQDLERQHLHRTRTDLHDAQLELARAREQNEEAQADLTAAKSDLASTRGDLARLTSEADQQRGAVVSLTDQLRESHEKLLLLSREIADTEARLATAQASADEGWTQLADQSRKLADTHDRLAAETNARHDLETALKRAQQEAGEERQRAAAAARTEILLRRDLYRLRRSVTYRTGQEVRAARKSLSAALMLPGRLWTIARDARAAGPLVTGEVVGQPAVQAVEGHAPPTRPAVTAEPSRVSPPRPAEAARDERLRVAAIVDDFTQLSLAPDCELHNLTPDGWRDQLAAARPDLLFVESAWRGKDNSWHNLVGTLPQELKDIVRWCRDRGVPTAFWNKEDPVHFSTFLTTASAFEYVFTTDIDCVPRYKAALGHDRVYLLPFAVQPRTHNPIEAEPRKDAFSFAGSYYRRYPERTKDLDDFLAHLPSFRPVEIYDRNFGKVDPNYTFPEQYRSLIVGTLPPHEVAAAYKRYQYGINLNSVKQSQTMFARRVFELLASNTITVSNYSRGLRLLFGDLVITTDSGAEAVRRLHLMSEDADTRDRYRLAALRSVMSQHTYADRLAFVLEKANGRPAGSALPRITLLGSAASAAELELLTQSAARQRDAQIDLVVVTDVAAGSGTSTPYRRIAPAAADEVAVGDVAADGLIAVIDARDYYGAHYAQDLALATRYSDAAVIGKVAHFAHRDGAAVLANAGAEYRWTGRIPLRRAAVRADIVREASLASLLRAKDTGLDAHQQLSIDRFSYCLEGGQSAEFDPSAVDDLRTIRFGTRLHDLVFAASALEPATTADPNAATISGGTMADWFSTSRVAGVKHSASSHGWTVTSDLEDGQFTYLYANTRRDLQEFAWDENACVYMDARPGLRLQLVLIFFDSSGQRLEPPLFASPKENVSAAIPPATASVRVGLRIAGPGETEIEAVHLSPVATRTEVQPTGDLLLLTNHYPTYENLYRNGFIHSRLRRYAEAGVNVEVCRFRANSGTVYGEFEGVDTFDAGADTVEAYVARSRGPILVHFLDRAMWEVIKACHGGRRVLVWVHGAEVQPWWRREYNYDDESALAHAKAQSEERLVLWREVLQSETVDCHFVFVSSYFAEEVMEDVGVRLSTDRYSIIHNPIDTRLFNYEPKSPNQRFNILSIRPFASRKYANDLSVAAIQMLTAEPWFDKLRITIVGDGPMWEETLQPLQAIPNIHLEKGFLSQTQIARLHKANGVFLVPTRMDAQGVSRDEAMSSGLVPISNAVAAVPEFVDDRSGLLVEAEDAAGLADALRRLVLDPEFFVRLSDGAAQRVRAQSDALQVLTAEIALIREKNT